MRNTTDNLFCWSLFVGLLIVPVDVRAQVMFSNIEPVAFSSSGVIPGASLSKGLSLTKEGLKQNEAAMRSPDLWIESQQFKFESGIGRPQRVSLLLTLNGSFVDDPGIPQECFFRYSADGRHWTSWQAFVDDEPDGKGQTKYSRRLRAQADVPQIQMAKFEEYRAAWKQRPESKGSDNEQKIAEWVLTQDPKFFDRFIPYIGFVQVRIEGRYWPGSRSVLKEVLLRTDWGFSGFRKIFR